MKEQTRKTIVFYYTEDKYEIIQKLMNDLPYKFSLSELVSICAHSVLELGMTGVMNDFLKTVEDVGRGGE